MTFESTPPNEEAPPPTQKERLPHSRWGIASFVITLNATIILLVLGIYHSYVCATIVQIIPNDVEFDRILYREQGIFVIFIGIGYVCLNLVAFMCGVVGIQQPHTRKVFAILGLCLSALPFILWIAYITFVSWL